MKMKLAIIEGRDKGKSFILSEDKKISIGRNETCDLYLKEVGVSRFHCKVFFENDNFWIEDCNSSNGTFVNKQKITKYLLYPDDIINLGEAQLLVQGKNSQTKPVDTKIIFAKKENEVTLTLDKHEMSTMLFHEVGKLVQSHDSLFQMLGGLLELLLVHLQVEQGYVTLQSENTQDQPISLFRSYTTKGACHDVFLISHSVLTQALNGIGTISADAKSDVRFGKTTSIHSLDISSILCVPIKGYARVLGAIYLDSRSENTGMFSKDKLDLLTAIGKQVGLALERKWQEEKVLQISEAKKRALLNAMPDLILSTDYKGSLLDFKPAEETKQLLSESAQVGQDLSQVLPAQMADYILRSLPIIVQDNISHTLEYQHLSVYYEIRIVGSREGEILIIIRNISKRRQIEDQLKVSQQQLRALSARLLSVQEQESMRIAREIHDQLGHNLTALKFDLAWLKRKQEIPPGKIEKMITLVDSTIQTVRKISKELRPVVLDDLGLAAAIEWQVQEFQERTQLECLLEISSEEVDIEKNCATTIFRVLQEALTNIVRHAKATKVHIKLIQQDKTLLLEVRDNGKGIEEKELQGQNSLGLLGIRERVLSWNGKVNICGKPGKGTLLEIKIPISSKTNES